MWKGISTYQVPKGKSGGLNIPPSLYLWHIELSGRAKQSPDPDADLKLLNRLDRLAEACVRLEKATQVLPKSFKC